MQVFANSKTTIHLQQLENEDQSWLKFTNIQLQLSDIKAVRCLFTFDWMLKSAWLSDFHLSTVTISECCI